jgi:hypothetical protein
MMPDEVMCLIWLAIIKGLEVGCRGRGRYKPLPPIGYAYARVAKMTATTYSCYFPPLQLNLGFFALAPRR